jgi:polyisoprenyl-phosphate glycosyltransferase
VELSAECLACVSQSSGGRHHGIAGVKSPEFMQRANPAQGSECVLENDVAIVTPVFNDWESLRRLLADLDRTLLGKGLRARVVVVDDGSTLEPDAAVWETYLSLSAVDVVRLRCNVGHQRAIATGMTYLNRSGVGSKAVVIMDADGEDRPEDVPHLLAQLQKSRDRCHVVFAQRTKRLESSIFRVMYQLYRFIHWLLTGISVRVGNFSALSAPTLPRLLIAPDTWNHYAAAVFRSRIPFSTVPLPRGKRYAGPSQMSYSSLVAHGLSAIAVFSEIVGARLIMLLSGVTVLAICLLAVVIIIRLTTNVAISGWATNAGGLIIVFTMQALLSLLILALLVLGDRSQTKVIPIRDAEMFIESVDRLPSYRSQT